MINFSLQKLGAETEDSMDVPSEAPGHSSPSSHSSSPRSEVADELEKSGFDFMESINTKRGTMQPDKDSKPFKNGLDMFADEIDTHQFNVGSLSFVMCLCVMWCFFSEPWHRTEREQCV